jgi:hypothetical protein
LIAIQKCQNYQEEGLVINRIKQLGKGDVVFEF